MNRRLGIDTSARGIDTGSLAREFQTLVRVRVQL